MTPGSVLIRPWGPKRRPAAHSHFSPSRARTPQRVSARPGAVCAPTGGPVRFPVQKISPRTGAHGHADGYGLRWPRGTRAISARSRLESGSRSRRDRVRASRPPKAVAIYLGVRYGSWRYDLRPESCWAARGGANGARPRAHPLWSGVREGEICECAAGRGLGPRGRIRTLPGATDISKVRSARLCRELRP